MRDVVQWETCRVGLGACVWCWAKPGLASQKPASVGISSLPGYKSLLLFSTLWWGFASFRTSGEPSAPTEPFGVKSLGFAAALGA